MNQNNTPVGPRDVLRRLAKGIIILLAVNFYFDVLDLGVQVYHRLADPSSVEGSINEDSTTPGGGTKNNE